MAEIIGSDDEIITNQNKESKMNKELIISKDLTPAIFFNKNKDGVLEVTNEVANLQKKVDEFNADVSTKKGQAAIRTFAAKLASSKIALDALGKDAVDDWNAKTKAVNAIRTTTKAAVQLMQDTVRKPLTDFENAEKERVAAHSNGINAIRESGDFYQINWQELSTEDMEAQLIETKGLDDGTWEEFNDSAVKNIKEAVEKIEAAITKKTQYDKDQSDLEDLRAATEVREQKERDDALIAKAKQEEREKIEQEAIVPIVTSAISRPVQKVVINYDDIPEPNERDVVQENMQKYGGGFVRALGVALTRADSFNATRIHKAFPDYWEEYLNFGKKTEAV